MLGGLVFTDSVYVLQFYFEQVNWNSDLLITTLCALHKFNSWQVLRRLLEHNSHLGEAQTNYSSGVLDETSMIRMYNWWWHHKQPGSGEMLRSFHQILKVSYKILGRLEVLREYFHDQMVLFLQHCSPDRCQSLSALDVLCNQNACA